MKSPWYKRWPGLKILVITGLVLVLSNLLVITISRINILDSLGKSITDFDFTDLYYSNLQRVPVRQNNDPRFLLVGIGQLNRAGLAALIDTINAHRPRVIAIDIFFSNRKDSIGDLLLGSAISKIKTCVFVSGLHSEDNFPPFDSVEHSHNFFVQAHPSGFGNLNIPESDRTFGTVRGFLSSFHLGNALHKPFAYQIVKSYDSTLLDDYPSGRSSLQFTNFFGFASKPWLSDSHFFASITFQGIDHADVLTNNFDPALIRDKIVLLGYMGEHQNPGHLEKFYTPLNERYAGRSLPDMFGVEVHANIVKTILDKRYLWNSPALDLLLSLGILFFSVWGCEKVHRLNPQQFQLISTTMIFVLINLLIFIPLVIFMISEVKLDMRRCLFYLLFVPTIYEVVDINLFQRLEHRRLKQT